MIRMKKIARMSVPPGYLTVIVKQTSILAVSNVFINYNSHKRRTVQLLTKRTNQPPYL